MYFLLNFKILKYFLIINMDSPQVLKKERFPEPEQMKIRSEIIDPIIANTSLVRFQVPKTGILSTGSMLTFQVQVADDVSAFFPLRTGCFGVFKKVELTLGGKTIQVQDESALYNTMKRQFRRCEDKYGIDQIQKGTLDRMTNSFEDNGILSKVPFCIWSMPYLSSHLRNCLFIVLYNALSS
jgi:hypothetical protein